MRRGVFSVAAAVIVIAASIIAVPSASDARPDGHRYVVVTDGDPHVAAEHARGRGAEIHHVYDDTIHGYAATMSARAAAVVAGRPGVRSVVPDGRVEIVHHRNGHGGGPTQPPENTTTTSMTTPPSDSCPGTQQLPWGVDRVDADTSSTAAGDCADSVNVSVYVIDTGVDRNHGDLNVVGHVNFAQGPNKDCHGHGTHVAGTIAATDNTHGVVGVAPGAAVTGVKVLGCSGSGWLSDVIAGVDWVTANAPKPAVANMSLGGGAYLPLDDAVKASADRGVVYAVAAGNSGADACTASPARAGTHAGVITTAATGSNETEASWSNYGGCVDIWAPGVSILSTASGGGTATMSGTSMASPHVAGGAALVLASGSASAASVESSLLTSAEATGAQSKDNRPIIRLDVGGF